MWGFIEWNCYRIMLLYNEICQHLDDPYNSVSQYFPNDDYIMLKNHAWVKDLLKVYNTPIDFYVTE